MQQTFFVRIVGKGFWDQHCFGKDLSDAGYFVGKEDQSPSGYLLATFQRAVYRRNQDHVL
jgi:hypothetical protein